MIAQKTTVSLRPTAQTRRRYRTLNCDGAIEIACASTAPDGDSCTAPNQLLSEIAGKTRDPELTSVAILPGKQIPAGGIHEL